MLEKQFFFELQKNFLKFLNYLRYFLKNSRKNHENVENSLREIESQVIFFVFSSNCPRNKLPASKILEQETKKMEEKLCVLKEMMNKVAEKREQEGQTHKFYQ